MEESDHINADLPGLQTHARCKALFAQSFRLTNPSQASFIPNHNCSLASVKKTDLIRGPARADEPMGSLAFRGKAGLAQHLFGFKALFTNEHDKGSNLLEVPDWNENHHGAGKGAEQDLYSFSDVALVRLGITVLGYSDKHKLDAILALASFKSMEDFAKDVNS